MPTEKIKYKIDFSKKYYEPKKEWIYLDSNPLLRQKSEAVVDLNESDQELINKMISYIDTCYNGEYEKYNIRPGIAIAAPQVGLLKRIIYIHFNDQGNEYQYLLINPEIISKSQSHSFIPGGEGCLSVPQDMKGNVERNYRIIVRAYDLIQQKDIEINASGLLSICLQHEIDHLDGILYTDHINKDNPNFYKKDWIKID